MGRPEQAAAMLPAFRRLAEEHGNVLTKAYALLSDGALEGPAAGALFTGIAERHQSTRHAFLGAFDQVYRLALLSRNPPRSVTLPYLPRPPAGGPRASDQVLSGSPERLDKLASELTRAGNSWERAGQAVSRHLSGLALNPAAGHSISQAGTWLAAQRPGLTRRRDQLLQTDTLHALQVAQGAGIFVNHGPIGQAKGLWTGVQHPKEFAKAMLNWDEWKRDPLRAMGHTIPTLVLTAATSLEAGAATRTTTALGKVKKTTPHPNHPHRAETPPEGPTTPRTLLPRVWPSH